MTVCGVTFVRNGVQFDYPFLESLRSLLPICDSVVVVVGNSTDGTLERIRKVHDQKIRVIETVWDESLRQGGAILAQQTNIALRNAVGDWAFYLQADEVLHERDYTAIRSSLEENSHDSRVDGLLFAYHHFYGGYRYVGCSRRWYRREVRAVRLNAGIESWGDAQGFRLAGRKLNVRPVDAFIYHYGWVKPPAIQQLKQRTFNKLWHDDAWIQENIPSVAQYDYRKGGRLRPFEGSHPSAMRERISNQTWDFNYDETKLRRPLRELLLDSIEDLTGRRIGEYKNYNEV